MDDRTLQREQLRAEILATVCTVLQDASTKILREAAASANFLRAIKNGFNADKAYLLLLEAREDDSEDAYDTLFGWANYPKDWKDRINHRQRAEIRDHNKGENEDEQPCE